MDENGQQWERNQLPSPPLQPKEPYCYICSILFNSLEQWNDHKKGQKHRKRRHAWLSGQLVVALPPGIELTAADLWPDGDVPPGAAGDMPPGTAGDEAAPAALVPPPSGLLFGGDLAQ